MWCWPSTSIKGIGQAVDDGLGGGHEIIDRDALRPQLADSVAAAVASLSIAGAQKSRGITGLRSSESSPTKRGRP
jgi:hypothetical protein